MKEINNIFTKKDLRNGDIAMNRLGELGIYLDEYDVLIYQNEGYDELAYTFNDDLSGAADDYYFDIMRVYHADGPLGFFDYEENGELVYERDQNWQPPTEAEMEAIYAKMRAQREAAEEKSRREAEEQRRKLAPEGQFLTQVMVQAFYGNRTMTEIYPKDFDALLRGNLQFSEPFEPKEAVERAVIRIPGDDKLVILYDESQERHALEDLQDYFEDQKQPECERKPWNHHEPKPLAVIPEKGIRIYSRCLACRMNEEGKFESLQSEDVEKIIKYLAE